MLDYVISTATIFVTCSFKISDTESNPYQKKIGFQFEDANFMSDGFLISSFIWFPGRKFLNQLNDPVRFTSILVLCVPEKVGPVPSYKFCFEEGLYIEIILMPSTFCYHFPKTWIHDSVVVMTSNVNFDERPILQLFVVTLCAIR